MIKVKSTRYNLSIFLVSAALLSLAAFALVGNSNAQSEESIISQIELNNQQIKDLEKRIAGYQTQIAEIGKEKNTLQNAIKTLEISGQKLDADIMLAQSKIDLAEQNIRKLRAEIAEAEEKIDLNKEAITLTLRSVQESSDSSLVQALLSHDSLSEYWGAVDTLHAFQQSVSASVDELSLLSEELSEKEAVQESLRQQEVLLRGELQAKAGLVIENKQEQSRILAETQGKESEYQELLEQSMRDQRAFEAEVKRLESQLNLNVDQSAIPQPGSGVLAWPVDNVIITQYFGRTEFAASSGYYHNGQHEGIDFGGPVGTPLKSAASGVVVGTGDTGLVCPGNASYGRWVLIRHDNGLSTFYAHLSQIGVSEGQRVERSERIGYMGSTGASTGPHLHFEVAPADAVVIADVPANFRTCPSVSHIRRPLVQERLNPLSFL